MTATTVVVDAGCTACGLCVITCPESALLPAPNRPLVVDDRCSACGACLEVCPRDAISEVSR
jgi:Pyruvate/2-oxoacid:ferredoxin oxidoreductase delta subunit